MAKKKKKLLIINFISVLTESLNDKFVTQKWQICYSLKNSKIPPSTSIHFATRVRRSCVLRLSFFTFLQDGSSIHDVSDPSVARIHLSWVKLLFIEPHKQNSNGVRSWALGGYCTGPSRSFFRSGNVSLRYCATGRIECGEAPSCW